MNISKFNNALFLTLIVVLICLAGCDQKETKKDGLESEQTNLSVLQEEIASKLREFEKNLRNGDSIALGNMYLPDAAIMPNTIGREKIVKNFAGMIKDRVTGSSFETTSLWGNDELLVEEGTGVWSYQNGEVVGRGTYIVVWKKEDGSWKILRDIWFPEGKK